MSCISVLPRCSVGKCFWLGWEGCCLCSYFSLLQCWQCSKLPSCAEAAWNLSQTLCLCVYMAHAQGSKFSPYASHSVITAADDVAICFRIAGSETQPFTAAQLVPGAASLYQLAHDILPLQNLVPKAFYYPLGYGTTTQASAGPRMSKAFTMPEKSDTVLSTVLHWLESILKIRLEPNSRLVIRSDISWNQAWTLLSQVTIGPKKLFNGE